jgi:hypothetical protein
MAGHAPPLAAEPTRARRKFRDLVPAWLILFVCGLMGLVCLYFANDRLRAHPGTDWAEVLKEIGTALIISCAIGTTVEISLKRREDRSRQLRAEEEEDLHQQRLRQIEENVFNYLFRFLVDAVILDEVKVIFAERFIRKGLRLAYKFSAAPQNLQFQDGETLIPHNELLTVRVTVEYNLCNMGRDPENREIFHYFESTLPLAHEHSGFRDFRVRRAGQRELTLKDRDFVVEDNPEHPIQRRIRVAKEHLRVEPGSPIGIFFIYETIRRCHDHEIWVSSLPADKFELSVTVDSSVRDMVFCADASHRSDPELVACGTDALRWEIRSGILPGQGMMLYWMPKSNSSKTEGPPHMGSAFPCDRPSDH